MDFNQVRKIAIGMGINTHRLKKVDIIQAIQRAEHNIPCFGAPRIDSCHELNCMWRKDCISYNHHKIAKTQ